MSDKNPFPNVDQPSVYYWNKFCDYGHKSTATNAVDLSIEVARNALIAGETVQETEKILKLGDINIQNIWQSQGVDIAMSWADKLLAKAQQEVAQQQQPEPQQPQMDRKQELLKQLDKELDF